jgi:hypothetical protein
MKTAKTLAASACVAVLGSIALLAGCAKQEAAAPAAPPSAAALPGGLKPEASVLDMMMEFIDPNADDLWDSVAYISTRAGVEERHPRTDADWKTARRKALTLVEAANLLVIEGRPVAHPGQNLAEPGGEGDFTPAQAQAEIDGNRASFVSFALGLQSASKQMLDAIDKRDTDSFLEAGGTLDEACENCHRKFWYPNSPVPPGA